MPQDYSKYMRGAEPIFVDKKSEVGVLLLHGFTSTPNQFKELADFLCRKAFSVSVPLIAGHGTCPEDLIKSCPEDWTASVKEAYFKLKKISKKIFIIGNSFGGNLGLWLAKELNNDPSGVITLGAPIYLRYQWLIYLRYYTYYRFKKYYRKSPRIYKIDYTDMDDEITYPVIPIKSFGDFLDFIKYETMPNLSRVKVPALIGHANVDPVVHPKSATYIYEHLGSQFKKIFWFDCKAHTVVNGKDKKVLFEKAYEFIKEAIK